MITAVTKSVEDTRALGTELAALVQAGDLIVLAGELGAGKTALVQGLGRGLGVVEPITSPAFVLVRTYPGRLPLSHIDVYRLERIQELVDLGIAELIDEGGVTAVEWGDVVAPALPPDLLEVRLTYGVGDDDRTLSILPKGPSWAPRAEAIAQSVNSAVLNIERGRF